MHKLFITNLPKNEHATARASLTLLLLAMAFLMICSVFGLSKADPPAVDRPPVQSMVIFEFELQDWSHEGALKGQSAVEMERLKLVTKVAREALGQSGQYKFVDVSTADDDVIKANWVRNCNGCEADIARRLGAELSFLGIVHKVSTLVHTVQFQIRDTHSGNIIRNVQTDLRGDTDQSWSRAVLWLIKNRLLEH